MRPNLPQKTELDRYCVVRARVFDYRWSTDAESVPGARWLSGKLSLGVQPQPFCLGPPPPTILRSISPHGALEAPFDPSRAVRAAVSVAWPRSSKSPEAFAPLTEPRRFVPSRSEPGRFHAIGLVPFSEKTSEGPSVCVRPVRIRQASSGAGSYLHFRKGGFCNLRAPASCLSWAWTISNNSGPTWCTLTAHSICEPSAQCFSCHTLKEKGPRLGGAEGSGPSFCILWLLAQLRLSKNDTERPIRKRCSRLCDVVCLSEEML